MGHLKWSAPRRDETRVQIESRFMGSANDTVSSVVKEVVSGGVCETESKGSVDRVTESDVVKSNGGQSDKKKPVALGVK